MTDFFKTRIENLEPKKKKGKHLVAAKKKKKKKGTTKENEGNPTPVSLSFASFL